MTKEKVRPIFVVCPTCEGVGFVLFESFEFAGFEEPRGLIRANCEKCGGTGEIMDEPITIKVKASEWARVVKERDKERRERKWTRSMLWELYWIAYDLKRSADAYVDGYNDSEDKKRIKLAKTAFKNFDKKIKKEAEKFRRHKNPET